jgi:secreted trypsin-like serine protease
LFYFRFTKFIRPACLWQTPNINSSKTIATGWGYTEALSGLTSEELMKVELDLINNRECNNLLEDAKLDDGIVDSQICAGVLTGGKDTCNGDSGG